MNPDFINLNTPITNYARNEGCRISARNKRRDDKSNFKRVKRSLPPLPPLCPGQFSNEIYHSPVAQQLPANNNSSEISLMMAPR